MNTRMLEVLIVLTGLAIGLYLVFYSDEANPAEVSAGAQVGACQVGGELAMCNKTSGVWHLYLQLRVPLSTYSGLFLSGDHYSRFDGSADLEGETQDQSGRFDSYLAGLYAQIPIPYGLWLEATAGLGSCNASDAHAICGTSETTRRLEWGISKSLSQGWRVRGTHAVYYLPSGFEFSAINAGIEYSF